MRTHFDISLPIHEGLVTYEGNPAPAREWLTHLEKGDAATVSHWTIGAHAGTHVDAPSHFLASGASVDELPWDHFCRPVYVYDCEGTSLIDGAVIDRMCRDIVVDWSRTGVLFHTSNSANLTKPFHSQFVALNASGAQAVVDHNIPLVGIDYLSIEAFGNPLFPVHKILLSRNVAIIEGLDLSGVGAGPYELQCLPIKLMGADGAPARAVLHREVGQ